MARKFTGAYADKGIPGRFFSMGMSSMLDSLSYTLVLRHDEFESFCTHGLGSLSQRERAGGEGLCSLAHTLETPHPLPAGEGKEWVHQNQRDSVLAPSRIV